MTVASPRHRSTQSKRSGGVATLEVYQQQRDRGRGDAADAMGLADRGRPHALEFQQDLGREPAHAVVIERGGNDGVFVATLALDLLALAFEVAGIFGLHLDLRGDIFRLHRGTEFDHLAEPDVIQLRSTQQIERVRLATERNTELAFDRRAQRIGRRGPKRTEPLGLALAAALVLWVGIAPGPKLVRGDRARIAIAAVLIFFCAPLIAAWTSCSATSMASDRLNCSVITDAPPELLEDI